MTARRLPAPLHPGAIRGEPVTLVVDRVRVPAFAGEPVAASLLAADRPVLSRSFRFHRPRGLMCSTGQCGWCECRIDGVPSVRSCRAVAADGLVIEGEHAWPTVRRDFLGALDLGSRWIAPTFYHHRFLRPRPLRKRYLDVIRAFGGRGRLRVGRSPAPASTGRAIRTLETEVAVIGGGPAGLAAAGAAAAAGARVAVLEAEPELGGPWRWREDEVPGGGPLGTIADGLAADPRVTLLTGAMVASIDAAGVHAITADALLDVRARAVVVATGSYERVPVVRGNDRPGVMGARTVEWLIRRHGIVPGARAVLVGADPDLDRAGAALRTAGTSVASIEAHTLAAIDGRSRVGGVRVRREGTVDRIGADLVVFSDRVSARELADAAAALGPDGPTVVLAGAAAGRPIGSEADHVAAAIAGRVAAAVGDTMPGDHTPVLTARPAPTPPGPGRPAFPARAMVCFCEDVRVGDLVRERRAGYGDPELLKRRTGSLTGPCQGKYCAPAFCAAAGVAAGTATDAPLPTTRPPARPIRLGDLVALDATGGDGPTAGGT